MVLFEHKKLIIEIYVSAVDGENDLCKIYHVQLLEQISLRVKITSFSSKNDVKDCSC